MKVNDQDRVCDAKQPGKILLEELGKFGPETDKMDFQLVLLAVLAGVVALFGLFLNNVGVIIGAMVISPLLEPMYAGIVELATLKYKKFLKHMIVLFGLLVMIILMSFFITYYTSLFSFLQITPEIISRTERADLYILLAIILGVVAVLSHKRGFISSITGVGIAIALVPPAVVVGISFAIYPAGIVQSVQLTFNNVFGMLAGMLIGILILGSGRNCSDENKLSRRMTFNFLMAILGLLSVVYLVNYLIEFFL